MKHYIYLLGNIVHYPAANNHEYNIFRQIENTLDENDKVIPRHREHLGWLIHKVIKEQHIYVFQGKWDATITHKELKIISSIGDSLALFYPKEIPYKQPPKEEVK